MKPVSFRYFAPRSVDDALDLLATHGEEGKILAGGQSLVPAMNFRLARPTSLIDINRIDALDYVREGGGELRIGALARHARFEAPVTGGVVSALLPPGAAHMRPPADPFPRHVLWKHRSCGSCRRMVLARRHTRCGARRCQPARAAQPPAERVFRHRAHDDLGTGRAPNRDPSAAA